MKTTYTDSTGLSRRRFVQGLAGGGVAAGLGLWPLSGRAGASVAPQATLYGNNFHLQIGETPVNFTGKARTAITVNHSLPAPTLRWRLL